MLIHCHLDPWYKVEWSNQSISVQQSFVLVSGRAAQELHSTSLQMIDTTWRISRSGQVARPGWYVDTRGLPIANTPSEWTQTQYLSNKDEKWTDIRSLLPLSYRFTILVLKQSDLADPLCQRSSTAWAVRCTWDQHRLWQEQRTRLSTSSVCCASKILQQEVHGLKHIHLATDLWRCFMMHF